VFLPAVRVTLISHIVALSLIWLSSKFGAPIKNEFFFLCQVTVFVLVVECYYLFLVREIHRSKR
jgi:hypothetical protein